MVKLEEDNYSAITEDYKETKIVPKQTYNYQTRRILVWIRDMEYLQMAEDALAYILPLATIRFVHTEEEASELAEKETWDTYVVDLTEENVSDSNFVKTANNNLEITMIALDYSALNREKESDFIHFDSIRKLFDLEKSSEDTFSESED